MVPIRFFDALNYNIQYGILRLGGERRSVLDVGAGINRFTVHYGNSRERNSCPSDSVLKTGYSWMGIPRLCLMVFVLFAERSVLLSRRI